MRDIDQSFFELFPELKCSIGLYFTSKHNLRLHFFHCEYSITFDIQCYDCRVLRTHVIFGCAEVLSIILLTGSFDGEFTIKSYRRDVCISDLKPGVVCHCRIGVALTDQSQGVSLFYLSRCQNGNFNILRTICGEKQQDLYL